MHVTAYIVPVTAAHAITVYKGGPKDQPSIVLWFDEGDSEHPAHYDWLQGPICKDIINAAAKSAPKGKRGGPDAASEGYSNIDSAYGRIQSAPPSAASSLDSEFGRIQSAAPTTVMTMMTKRTRFSKSRPSQADLDELDQMIAD